MSKVPVYQNGEIVAQVEYNENLDHWDGSNWTSGGVGKHLGVTKLKDGRFVLIYGTQWQGERDYAEVVSNEEALQEILKSGNEDLLNDPKFAELKELLESMAEEA